MITLNILPKPTSRLFSGWVNWLDTKVSIYHLKLPMRYMAILLETGSELFHSLVLTPSFLQFHGLFVDQVEYLLVGKFLELFFKTEFLKLEYMIRIVIPIIIILLLFNRSIDILIIICISGVVFSLLEMFEVFFGDLEVS